MISTLLLTVVLAQTPEELIKDLDANNFKTRNAATIKLVQLVEDDDKAVIEAIRKNIKAASPEKKARLRTVLAEYFSPIMDAEVPIWSLPDEYRYVKDVDVAEEYYKKAREKFKNVYQDDDEKMYNHSQLMRDATWLYMSDWIKEKKSRKEMQKLVQKMLDNWAAEKMAVLESTQPCEIRLSKAPRSFKDRLKGTKGTKDKTWKPHDAVVDHDRFNFST